MRSWLSRIARTRCERELYRPSYMPKATYRVLQGMLQGRLARVLTDEEAVRRMRMATDAALRVSAMNWAD